MPLDALELLDNDFVAGSDEDEQLSPAAEAALQRRQLSSATDFSLVGASKKPVKKKTQWGEIESQQLTDDQRRDLKLLSLRHVLSRDGGGELDINPETETHVQFVTTVTPAIYGKKTQERKSGSRSMMQQYQRETDELQAMVAKARAIEPDAQQRRKRQRKSKSKAKK